MKTISLFVLLLLSVPAWTQQTFTQKIGATDRVVVKFFKSEMMVEAHSGNEILIEALNYKAPPERAKGLRPLYNSAMDNTNIGLQIEKIEGGYEIREASRQDGKYLIKLPATAKLSIWEMNWGGEDIKIKGMKSEIEVKSKNADVRLTDITGPVIVNSTSGDIEIDFSSFSQAGPSSINAISGDVDVTMPASAKANYSLTSISGEIYTDLDLKLGGEDGKSRKEAKEEAKEVQKRAALYYIQSRADGNSGASINYSFVGHTIKATANGGGASFTIRATSSDIYLRKK